MSIPTRFLSTLSLAFLLWLHGDLAEECEKMTGALENRRASSIDCSATWEMSTIIPRRFISSTTLWWGQRIHNWREIRMVQQRYLSETAESIAEWFIDLVVVLDPRISFV